MAHTIEVILSPALFENRRSEAPFDAVVVDVLRATTTICAALQSGADYILPVASPDELAGYRRQGYVTAAERKGLKVEGADFGNSPAAMLAYDLRGKRLAYNTTNGTNCLRMAAGAAHAVYAGAFVNIDALTQRIRQNQRNLLILCSGSLSKPCMEDTLFAGCLAQRMAECGYATVEDSVLMAMALWRQADDDAYGFCKGATHVQRLTRLGFVDDVRIAFTMNRCPIVPTMRDGRIVKSDQ